MSEGSSIPEPRVYTVIGREVESDIPLRGLHAHSSARVDVRIVAAQAPPPRGPMVHESRYEATGEPAYQIFEGDAGIQWWVDRVGTFWVAPGERTIHHRLLPGAEQRDIEQLLLGPVPALVAQRDGAVLLHASSILIGGQVAAFCGPSGTGKSTVGAALALGKYPLVSDDILPVELHDDHVLAMPYLPSVRLWPDSLEALGQDPEQRPVVSSFNPKRLLDAEAFDGGVPHGPLPLGVVYLLSPAPADACIAIEALPEGVESLLNVLHAFYLADLQTGARGKAALAAAASLLRTTPVRRLVCPRRHDALPDLARAVEEDLRQLLAAR